VSIRLRKSSWPKEVKIKASSSGGMVVRLRIVVCFRFLENMDGVMEESDFDDELEPRNLREFDWARSIGGIRNLTDFCEAIPFGFGCSAIGI
jgi:hypothetical protein